MFFETWTTNIVDPGGKRDRRVAGLDIGYVPAGSHAFLRLSGQFEPPQFVLFFSASYAAIIFTGNRQNSEGNVNSYLFFVIYRPNVQKCATSRVKS